MEGREMREIKEGTWLHDASGFYEVVGFGNNTFIP